MAIPEVMEILKDIQAIHEKKNRDYAAVGHPFENFERSGHIANWFSGTVDKSFTVLIGTKLARLATLLDSDNPPNNESIDDSFLDLATYCILWGAFHKYLKRGFNKETK